MLGNIAWMIMCFLAGKGAGELAWQIVKRLRIAKAHPAIGAAIMLLVLAATVAVIIIARKE